MNHSNKQIPIFASKFSFVGFKVMFFGSFNMCVFFASEVKYMVNEQHNL